MVWLRNMSHRIYSCLPYCNFREGNDLRHRTHSSVFQKQEISHTKHMEKNGCPQVVGILTVDLWWLLDFKNGGKILTFLFLTQFFLFQLYGKNWGKIFHRELLPQFFTNSHEIWHRCLPLGVDVQDTFFDSKTNMTWWLSFPLMKDLELYNFDPCLTFGSLTDTRTWVGWTRWAMPWRRWRGSLPRPGNSWSRSWRLKSRLGELFIFRILVTPELYPGIHIFAWNDVSYETRMAYTTTDCNVNVVYRNNVYKKNCIGKRVKQSFRMRVVSYETLFPKCEHQFDMRFV